MWINEIDVNILNKTISCLKNIYRKNIFFSGSFETSTFEKIFRKKNKIILNGKEWKWRRWVWVCVWDGNETKRQTCHTNVLFCAFLFGQFRSGFSSVSSLKSRHSYGPCVEWQENFCVFFSPILKALLLNAGTHRWYMCEPWSNDRKCTVTLLSDFLVRISYIRLMCSK